MKNRLVLAATVAVLMLAVASCGDDDADADVAAVTTTVAPGETTTTLAPESTTSTAETTTTEEVETTSTASETTTTEAATGISTEDLTLDGVSLGDESDSAISDLIDRFGAPTTDNGWEEGCPFDGEGLNERVVQWGGLNAYFTRPDDSSPGVFQTWWYRVNFDTGAAIPGGPTPDQIDLPGDIGFGDPISEVEVRLGLPITFDDVFQLVYVSTESYTISTYELDASAPIVSVGVPFVPACD